jgi:Putative transposase
VVGVLCGLHTWSRALASHPHVHGLVPAGGGSADHQQWRPARPTSLVPVRALSAMFRGRFCALVHQARPDLNLPESVWSTAWVVYGKPTVQGTARVLDDLGRSVHRIALTNSRMLSIDEGRVCFRYADSRTHRWKTMTLPAQEFIRRLLPPVLPQGFHNVRYDGLWSPAHGPLLHQLQLCLAGHEPSAPLASPDRERRPLACAYAPLQAGQLGPHGGPGWLVVIRLLPRYQRGPP